MGKKNKNKKFKINTRGNEGKKVQVKKTAKKYTKKKVTSAARKAVNQAAVQKFGSRKKADKKGHIVGKNAKVKGLASYQKKEIGIKGSVNTRKELDNLRNAIGFNVDRGSDKVGSLKFAKYADKRDGQREAKAYANKAVDPVLDKLKESNKDRKNLRKDLSNYSSNLNDLNAANLGLNDQLGSLQGMYNNAIDRINGYDKITNGLTKELGALRKSANNDRNEFNEEIGNFNTLINNLEMKNDGLVADYEQRIANDRESYNTSLGLLQDSYALQSEQATQAAQIYADQQRRSQNMRRAYVPSSNQVAGNPLVGDRRKGRKAADRGSALSSLTISTGLGKNANPLAGLQLA